MSLFLRGIIVIGIGLSVYGFFAFDIPYSDTPDSFKTCVLMGNPVMESYPRQCRDKHGTLFIEEITSSSTVSITNSF